MEIARNRNCKDWKLQGRKIARSVKCKEGNCKEWKLQGNVSARKMRQQKLCKNERKLVIAIG